MARAPNSSDRYCTSQKTLEEKVPLAQAECIIRMNLAIACLHSGRIRRIQKVSVAYPVCSVLFLSESTRVLFAEKNLQGRPPVDFSVDRGKKNGPGDRRLSSSGGMHPSRKQQRLDPVTSYSSQAVVCSE